MLKYFEIVTNIKVTNISNLIKKIHFMILDLNQLSKNYIYFSSIIN